MSLLNNRYEKIAKIGEGSFGRVFLACDHKASISLKSNNDFGENKEEKKEDTSEKAKNQSFVALKKLKSSEKLKDKIFEITEIKYLSKISHENIIKISEAFFDKDAVYMVLDYMGYDLEKLAINYHDRLNMEDYKIILSQIFQGVLYLHEKNLIHRDLKTSNMLIDGNGLIKISDFSLIREIPDKSVLMTKNVVTRYYRPPEIIFGCQYYGKSVDIWSLGCVMAEVFLGGFLFEGGTDIEQLSQIFKLLGSPTEEIWPGCTSLPFFIGFEINEPKTLKKRIPKLTEDALDLLSKMLVLDPSKRITINDALKHSFFSMTPELKGSKFMNLMKEIENKEQSRLMKIKK